MLLALIIGIGLCIPAALSPAYAAKAPAKPTKVKVISLMDTSCGVTWKNVKGVKQYDVQYKKASAKKWNLPFDRVSENYYSTNQLKGDTKYQVRVRSVKGGKKSAWSDVKSFTTLMDRTPAIWPTYIDEHKITIAWYPSKGAKKYEVTWYQDNPGEDDHHETVKGTEFTAKDLQEGGGFTFVVTGINGKKKSAENSILLGTYGQGSGITMKMENGYCELTRFLSGHDFFPGSETEIPALYDEYYDEYSDDGDVKGYYFPTTHVKDSVTLYYGEEYQDGKKINITEKKTYKIGDSFVDIYGNTRTIKSLTIITMPDGETFQNCADLDEVYRQIDEYRLTIGCDDGFRDVEVSWTPWRPY